MPTDDRQGAYNIGIGEQTLGVSDKTLDYLVGNITKYNLMSTEASIASFGRGNQDFPVLLMKHKPLTKAKFIKVVAKAARAAGLDPRQVHGIRIGSTLEYLLRGTPFDVMKVKGRWASDAFQVYLTKHAQILAPYMQAAPEIQTNFIRLTMPPPR